MLSFIDYAVILSSLGIFIVFNSIFLKWLHDFAEEKLPYKLAKDLIPIIRATGHIYTISELISLFSIKHKIARNTLHYLYNVFELKQEITALDKIAKQVTTLSENYGGIITIPKAYIELEVPLEVLSRVFKYLENHGIAKRISDQMYDFRGIRKLSDELVEILKFAEEQGGVITIEDMVKKFKWPAEKIEASLEELEKMGIAIKEEDIGKIQWYFPGIYRKAKLEEKTR